MKVQKSAISSVLVVVILVVIVVVAAGAYYLVSVPSSRGTSTSSPTSQTSTVSTTSTTSTSSAASSSSSSSATSTMTSQSSTSSATPETLTATCTTTTTNSTFSIPQSLLAQFNAYPSMTLSFQGKTSSMSTNRTFTFTYSVVSVNSTTYQMNAQFVAKSGKSLSGSIWFLKNGTISALENSKGQYYYGANASNVLQPYLSEFATAQEFVQDQSIYSNLFHSTGTSTATIGTNTFTVTNYVANALPETIQRCNGAITTLTTYNLSLGTPSGSSVEVATYANAAGWTITSGTNSTFDFTIQTTAFTVA